MKWICCFAAVAFAPMFLQPVFCQSAQPTSHSTVGAPETNELAAKETALFVDREGRRISIREATDIHLPLNHATAAYSLDPLIAQAQVAEGELRIWGRAPGQAVIVLVSPDFSTSTMQVTVTRAPPILPERVWSGLNSGAGNRRGSYEFRLSSDPIQISDALDYRTSRAQLHFTNAIVPSRDLPGVSTVWFPNTYVRIFGDRWRATLLDQDVESTPISVNSTLIRGIHFSAGDVSLHAGYTSAAGFQSLFIPVERQLISGATFAHHLSSHAEMGLTGYFIQRDGAAIDRQVAQGVGTLFFRLHTSGGYDLSAEAGFSKGIGGALEVARDTSSSQFHADARYRPRQYAAPDTDNLNGLQSNLLWDRIWSGHLVSTVSGSANHIFTRAGAQEIDVGTGNLVYKFLGGVSLTMGSSISRFSESHAPFPDIRRLALPVTLSYDGKRFGVSGQYEFSRTTNAFSAGQGYRGSLRWNGQHLHMNANAGLDTQSLGVDSVFSTFPELDVALAQLGFGTSISAAQLANLLNDRAFLNSLGLAPNATLQLVPRSWQAGVNLSWQGARQVFELDSNYNLNSFLTQRNATFLQTIQGRRGITNSTEFIASFTWLDSITPTHRWEPLWQVGLRHEFDASPFRSWHRSHGVISGTVRLEDGFGSHPLRGAQITLDSDRRAVSGSDGRYAFTGVGGGDHVVAIAFQSSRPFWYASPSKVDATANSIVDFGVVYPSAEIIGYVLSDAGIGLAGIGVKVGDPQEELNLITDQTGKFAAPFTRAGEYRIRVNEETVPDGYALDGLEPARVSVNEGESKKVSFTLKAIRALAGSVQVYDPVKEAYVPLADASIQLAELDRTITTDSKGGYLCRNLPSGTFTIRVNGQQCGKVQMTAAPQLLRYDIRVGSCRASLEPERR